MKIQIIIRVLRMILLTAVVSLTMLALVYIIKHPQMMVMLASIGWNR